MNTKNLGACMLLTCCAVMVSAADLAPLPTDRNYVFNVSDMFTYDKNIFRLPAAGTPGVIFPGPGSSESDEINTAALGMVGDWGFGLQSVRIKLDAADNAFVKNSDLDNVSGSGKLEWDWVLADLLTGKVGVDYSHYLADFANTQFYSKDLISDFDYYLSGIWVLGPHWHLTGNLRGETATHSATVREGDDYENGSGSLGAEYALSLTNALGLEYQFTRVEFRQGDSTDGILGNRDYQDNAISAYVKYSLTAVTKLEAGGGYVNRDYKAGISAGGNIGNFSGGVWHLTVNWQPTVQSGIRIKAWRDLRAYVDAESNYFVSRGFSIGPVWSPIERLAVTLDAARETQNYIGSGLVIGSLPQRRDTLTTAKFKIEYKFRRRLEIDLGYNYEKRASDQTAVAYDDNMATAALRYSF